MSTPFRLLLPRSIYEEMLAQALAELPNECCGLLAGLPAAPAGAGPVARVVRRYPLVNAARSPKEYHSEPRSMFEADRDMRQRGLGMLAIYHSHPTTDPEPSKTDLERNFYGPEVMHFIISLKEGTPRIRGWWLTPLDFREAEWEYTD